MLTEVISKQISSLQILVLSDNNFSYNSTEKLLKGIIECGICSTLKELNLDNSVNFDSGNSQVYFAKILAKAPVL